VPGFDFDGCENDSAVQSARYFLHQNGLASVHEVDKAGWRALHYAAMRGDPLVIQ
ncbi:ANKHD1, partial [Symbiodinium pilosum]